MSRDKPESLAQFQKLSVVKLLFQSVNISDQHAFIFFSPAVINLNFLVFIQDQRLVQQRYLRNTVRVCNPITDTLLVFTVANSLH